VTEGPIILAATSLAESAAAARGVLAYAFETPGVSWIVLLGFLAIVVASVWVFLQLVWIEERDRERQRLREWCRQQRFRLMPADTRVPAPLNELVGVTLRIEWWLSDGEVDILKIQTRPHDAPPEQVGMPDTWHLICTSLPPMRSRVALRPDVPTPSAIDLLRVPPSELTRMSKRFDIRSDALLAARQIVDGPILGLIPGDVGLARLSNHLLLDFTSRPFDPIELSRAAALIRQLRAAVVALGAE
jgi:hypothetical protein